MNYTKLLAPCLLGIFTVMISSAQEPIEYIQKVADRVIAHSALKLRAVPFSPSPVFQKIETVDFQRSFNETSGTAYAYSALQCATTREIPFQVGHAGMLTVWVNDKVVYKKEGERKVSVNEAERGWTLPNQ